jgi:Ser/Thr protein kinase RdoA (MazF antagonist)
MQEARRFRRSPAAPGEASDKCSRALSSLAILGPVADRVDQQAICRALLHYTTEPIVAVAPLGSGHIHQTFEVRTAREHWVLQRINTHVFADVDRVMDNVGRVTAHLAQRLGPGDPRRVLRLRPTRAAASYAREDAAAWRVFDYVEHTFVLDRAAGVAECSEAGRAFGSFARWLSDLPEPPLHTTLPDFHATDRRRLQLEAAVARDPLGRAAEVRAECAFVAARAALADESARWAAAGELPLRVTHNDTKLNNLLFDQATRAALCVIDLDTVMPGHLAYDFGDLVRTAACSGDEDARDHATQAVSLPAIAALARSYVSELGGVLTPRERASLARGPAWIVLELGMRFLTDHVLGDRYFAIARPNHNLDRARAQFALLTKLEAHTAAIEHIVMHALI